MGKRNITNMIIIVLFISIILFSCEKDNAYIEIGINQFMEHPLLDDARKGMMSELEKQGITEENNYHIVYKNANGDQVMTNQINTQYIRRKVDVIIALGTPSAQSACNLTKNIPVVFGVITDPVASGIADSEMQPGGNKTGTSDRWPYEMQIGLIKKIVSEAKRVGIVLNPGESNTEASMKYIEPLLKENNMTAVKVPVSNASEVMNAARSLVGRCDVMLIPGDNTVIAAISSIVKVANDHDIPLFAGSTASVEKGALATYGNNYYQIGEATGRIVAKILKESIKASDIGKIPVMVATDADLIINLGAAKEQNVSIPEVLLQQAKTIIP